MTQTVDSLSALVKRIRILQAEQPTGQRLLIAIVGAPGAGKSTLASTLCQRLNEPQAGALASAQAQAQAQAGHGESAVVVPMDGFHLDNTLLERRSLMAVKGSPQTFDVDGLTMLLERLVSAGQEPVYIPVFDREADLSRNAAQCVDAHHSIILVEGNYLLLRRAGWQRMAPLFHLSIMLDVPMSTLEQRLVQRWLDHGLEADAARQRALSNDIPNARTVIGESSAAHLRYQSVRE